MQVVEFSKSNRSNFTIYGMAILFLAIPSLVFAQTSDFKKALKEARKPGQPYHARIETTSDFIDIYKRNCNDICQEQGYHIISSSLKKVARREYVYFYDFVPDSEYQQYKKEVDIVNNGGLLDFTKTIAAIPTDAKSLAKAEGIYKKALKTQSLKLYHEAALLGSLQAKAAEARCYAKGRGTNKDWVRAHQLVDEVILSDDPNLWAATADLMSNDGKAYVAWRKNETQDVPFRFLWQYKGKEEAEKRLREVAEGGNLNAAEQLGKLLWDGVYISNNKNEAVKWLKKVAPISKDAKERLIVAKGEGFFTEPIPQDWYEGYCSGFLTEAAKQGNMEALLASWYKDSSTSKLKMEVEKGNRRAAEVLDMCMRNKAHVMEEEMLALLNHSSQTGYDKYEHDVSTIQRMYDEIVAYCKADKKELFNSRHEFAHRFVTFYSKYPNYDKKRMLKTAKTVMNFCNVNDALYSMREDPQTWEYKNSFFDRKPVLNTNAENYYFKKMNEAIASCKQLSIDPTLGSYFKKVQVELNAKNQRARNNANSDHQKFQEAARKYDEEKERIRKSLEDISRANSVSVPQIRDIREGNHGRFIDSDQNYDDTDHYIFSDGTEVVVHHRYIENDTNYYYPDSHESFVKYNTAVDAAGAGWVFKKMGLLRTVGEQK